MDMKRYYRYNSWEHTVQYGNFWCFTVVRKFESTSCRELCDNSEFWSGSTKRQMDNDVKKKKNWVSVALFVLFITFTLLLSFVIILYGWAVLASDTQSNSSRVTLTIF